MSTVINKAAVRRALEQWFIAARAGETLGARETAELSAHDAAAQSSDYFYDLLCLDQDAVTVEALESKPTNNAQFVVGEDLVAGQIATFNDQGQIVAHVGEALPATEPQADAPTNSEDLFD